MAWVILISLFVGIMLGIALCLVVRKKKDSPDSMEQLKAEYESYQNQTTAQFTKTAALIGQISEQLQIVQTQLFSAGHVMGESLHKIEPGHEHIVEYSMDSENTPYDNQGHSSEKSKA